MNGAWRGSYLCKEIYKFAFTTRELSHGIRKLQRKTLLLIIQLTCNFAFVNSQDISLQLTSSDSLRNIYVEDRTDHINAALFLYSSRNGFTLNSRRNISFEPNEAIGYGIRLQHKWLGLAFSFAPKNIQEKRKGETDYTNFQLNTYGRKIGFDFYYMSYSGFYIENYRSFPVFNTYKESYPQRPDMNTSSIGANLYYIFNHNKFSYRSGFVQNEIQKKSAGSFLLTASAGYYAISADSSLVPELLYRNDMFRSRLKEGHFTSAGLLAG